MVLGQAAQSALLIWVNTFPLGFKVESWADLSDGVVLSKALADIDSSYVQNVTTKGEGLKTVVNGLFRYVRRECYGIEPLLGTPGLRAIADQASSDLIFEILTVFLMAAISGPDRQAYVMSITRLVAGVQAEIAKTIQQQQEIEKKLKASEIRKDAGGPANTDFELEFEVRYTALIAQKKNLEQEKERLKKQMADMTTRLGRLQDNNELLQQRLTAAEDGLSGAATDEETAKVIKGLEAKVREQDELIANQEGQVEQDRGEKLRMRTEIDRLRSSKDLVDQLQDENKELRYQNLELTKKANTVERYKQKLESQRDFQTELKSLELENEELKQRCRDFEHLKDRNVSLEATHVRFQDTIGKREVEIFELAELKNSLKEEKADLERALRRLEESKAADEEHINELQEQLEARPQSMASPAGATMGTLEDELENTGRTDQRTSVEVSRLRAENLLLKGNAMAAQEAATLRLELGQAERARKREEAKYNELFERHVVASQQLSAVLEAATSEGSVKLVDTALGLGKLEVLTPKYYSSEAFSNLRKMYLRSTEQLSTATGTIRNLESELENTRRELLVANTDLSMIAKEDIDALEELKATQESLASSTEAELNKIQSQLRDLEIDHEQQKSQLIEALLSKDKLQKEVAEFGNRNAVQQAKNLSDKLASDLQASTEQIQKQDIVIRELQARIKDLEANGNDARKPALEQELSTIRRETNMIVSAWYDLTSRLQSNHVVLQRRQDAPKSWIAQQRQAVNVFTRK